MSRTLLDAFLRACETPKDRSTLNPQQAQDGTPKLPPAEKSSDPSLPFDPREIKRSLGLDPDDPNVQVQFIPFPGLGRVPNFDKLFADIFGTAKARQEPHPVQAAGEQPEENVTAPVTNAPPDHPYPGPYDNYDLYDVVDEVIAEVKRARAKHAPMNSPHEGYAVILEELDDLWDEIRVNAGRTGSAREEAVQIAAMAIRYLIDIQPRD